MKYKRYVLIGVAAVAVAVATGLIVLQPGVAEVRPQADVRTAPPLVKLVNATDIGGANRSYTGFIAARVQSNLGFRVSGKIIERLVSSGEQVRAGQPLMRIDDNDLRLELTAKQNAVLAARAAVIQARADERRYAALVKTASASRQRYEQARSALDTAQALLASAEAEARVAENAQAYALLEADADGTVVETLGEPGQVVAAGQVVVRLAHSGPREAVISLPETQRPPLGSLAEVSLYGADSVKTQARLRQLSDSADPQTRTYEARYVIDGDASSAPLGATVSVLVQSDAKHDEVQVPIGALHDTGDDTGVWVFNPQTSAIGFHPVTIKRIGEETAVVSGLDSAVSIVALGAHLLNQGELVRVATQIENEP